MADHYKLCSILKPAILLCCGFLFLSACTGTGIQPSAGSNTGTSHSSALPEISICQVPDPAQPSSAFHREQSIYRAHSGYWVRYSCKVPCSDWRQCTVPAHADDGAPLLEQGRRAGSAKLALALVVDGMAGHIAFTPDGDRTVFIHTGAGGTRYYIKPALGIEQRSNARTVMMRWEKGYTSPIVQPPFTRPITWGWYSRTSESATNIKALNRRVASVMQWVHDELSGDYRYGTLGCSMGTNATFGPVLWHGLDPVVDYQTMVGGPNMWDLNAQCGRRVYSEGYCDVDGITPCSSDAQCAAIATGAKCAIPGEYTTIDRLFAQLPDHIHKTDACDIRANLRDPVVYPPFDESSMGFAEGTDWQIDHPVDFLVNVGKVQGSNRSILGGDSYWALGHFPMVYNRIKPDRNKSWRSIPDSHHCDAMYDQAIDVLIDGMGL